MSTENKEIIRRLIDEVWNQREIHVLDEIIAADAFIHSPTVPNLSRGPEGAKQYVQLFWAAFPDLRVTTDDLVAEGDKVALRWSASGTHKGKLLGIEPTGKPMTITGQAIYTIVRGKITEDWINADTMGMLQQLGIVPRLHTRSFC
ncbi:MAG: ester cyclase [Gammaproteobacteria bacterium]